MWICSSLGFFSIVAKKKNEIHVRARVPGDLENLNRECFGGTQKIHHTANADYCSRIVFEGDNATNRLAEVMACLAKTITYSNFKGMISDSKDQHHKCGAYTKMWGTMMDVQRSQRGEDRSYGGHRQMKLPAFHPSYYTTAPVLKEDSYSVPGRTDDEILESIENERRESMHGNHAPDMTDQSCTSCGRPQYEEDLKNGKCWYCGKKHHEEQKQPTGRRHSRR